MNRTLFKTDFRSNWSVLVIILAVMFMYISILISMFDPNSMEEFEAMLNMMPKEIIAAMGFDDIGTTITTYLGGTYYNFIAIMFPMIYCIIVANRLVAKHVDRGSMAYLLSTPNSRLNIVATQAFYLISSITVLFSCVTVVGIVISQAVLPGELNIKRFLLLNVVTLFMFYAVGGISFLFSCIFNDTKYSLGFGAGFPIAFFVINMLANVGDELSWLKYFTIFTLLNPDKILTDNSFAVLGIVVLLCIAFIMFTGGVLFFNRKDLPV